VSHRYFQSFCGHFKERPQGLADFRDMAACDSYDFEFINRGIFHGMLAGLLTPKLFVSSKPQLLQLKSSHGAKLCENHVTKT
jgi:hypothetical protein